MFKKFLLMVFIVLLTQSNVYAKNFNWDYFSTLDKNENIFYSSYSISVALSIVANGATGKTQDEILNALDFHSIKNLNSSYKNLSQNYKNNGLTFNESNLILVSNEYSINKDYQKLVDEIYHSTVRNADFKNNLNAEKKFITEWVAQKTNHFIKDYQSIITKDSVFDILNVIYFKGDWHLPFNDRWTRSEQFINQNKTKSTVQMMNKTFDNEIKYHEDKNFKAIELPYQKLNGKTIASMYVILPMKASNFDIADEWNKQSLDYKLNFMNQIKNAPIFQGKVIVKIPKFELDIENKIVNNLKAINIKRSFSDNAEFSNMVNESTLKIGNVNHRAKIKVDEVGTEAVAITEIDMLETSAIAPEPKIIKNFYADSPFLFIIKGVPNDIDLFTGVMNKF